MIAWIRWAQEETLRLGEGQELNLAEIWDAGGFMMWPLGICLAVGILVIVWKLVDLQMKAARNRSLLKEADGLIAEGRLEEALAVCEDSRAPAAVDPGPLPRRRSHGAAA